MSKTDTAALIDAKVAQGETLASMQDVLMQLGQIQAFNFVGRLVTVTELKIAQKIKETKSYKGLTYRDDSGNSVTVTTWEDCCKHILKTDVQNIDNRLRNLQQFGEEFFEQAQKMKLGYRDLRALRQLPEEDQAIVIESEAVDSGDKEAVKELIDELKDKHNQETTKLKTELDASDRMLKASRKTSTEKEDELVKLRADLESKKFSSEKWKGETKNFFEALAKTQNQIRDGFNQMLQLSEQLETIQIDDKTYNAAKSAFYADNKILLTQLAGMWNEIHRTYGDLDDAKPSGEWLVELGFEGTEVME
ncbi:hypothetical protein N473_07065 [Pseudoalteromonas luteoviolacea CPMOR-1]|uniref:Uncharacterized protein n=1 Tax=Pseudoalteromonas luteoviolacea CPMOR-1 TaxID=1365248 RepID=A0A162ASA8_9GAMM|nr:hypothetical protein [Pseudoalteromonas luteoviolacea]KZN57629.1 hypothetical protein N473_07065 [Pseudoalteromonas luteoviolacea CPMOR-1]